MNFASYVYLFETRQWKSFTVLILCTYEMNSVQYHTFGVYSINGMHIVFTS